LTLHGATIDPQAYHALVSGQARGLGPAVQRLGLRAASVPYGWAMRLRNRLYDRGWKHATRAPVPVVSVGNLTLGGTGKTPCVEYIARHYRERDRRVAILSRGYGNSDGPNDEALVLEENLPDVPHLQGTDRAALAAVAVEELESEILLLDDGFQHRRLARDLDIVLIDATAPWGHGYIFPRGLLREPVAGLRRAHLLLLTRCDQADDHTLAALRQTLAAAAPGVPLVETEHRPMCWTSSDGGTHELTAMRDRPIAAFCGLGNPEAFRRTLHDLGLKIAAFRTFPDHHRYQRADIDDLAAWAAQQPADAVIATTQKDLVKIALTELADRPLCALRIGLHVRAGEEALTRALDGVLT